MFFSNKMNKKKTWVYNQPTVSKKNKIKKKKSMNIGSFVHELTNILINHKKMPDKPVCKVDRRQMCTVYIAKSR